MRLFLKGLLINFKFLSPIGWGPAGGGGGGVLHSHFW